MNNENFEIRPELFLRAPFYSFEKFNLGALQEVILEQPFQNALWLASPGFHALLKSKNFDWEKLTGRERHTLAKYFNRMCFRPTPFGSFASFTNLRWDGDEPVVLGDDADTLLHLLPDRALSAITFKQQRPFGPETLLIKNPTIYRVGEYFRYIHTAYFAGGSYRFTIDQTDAAELNAGLLALFRDHSLNGREVARWIGENAGCTDEEANDYLRFLIDEQVLYTPEQGSLICSGPIDQGRPAKLWESRRRLALQEAGPLDYLVYDLAQLYAESNGAPRKAYCYAALERPLRSGGLNAADREEFEAALKALQLLAAPSAPDGLGEFTRDFLARFDLRKVPLLTALDPDAGIPYGDRGGNSASRETLNGIRFPAAPTKPAFNWDQTRRFFLKRWLAGGNYQDSGILIDENDLHELAPEGQLPPSAAVMFRKTREGLFIESAGGCSATQLIGRFSLFSEETAAVCRILAAAEQEANPGVVFADIEQISDNYLDNINQRRPVYDFVIPLNVYSRVPAGQQLLPEDLELSVRGGELILESRRLGKRVIPRLASAYNYRLNELPLFRLLGDLQTQNLKAAWGLDLALLFPGLPFYPRVSYRRTVLAPAKWVMEGEALNTFRNTLKRGSPIDPEFPQWVTVGQHDQRLVINQRESAERQLLLEWLNGKTKLVMTEYLLPDGAIQSGGQNFAGQFIGFLTRSSTVYPAIPRPTHPEKNKTRSFLPGSDWLYVKLYCTPACANTLLDKVVGPVIERYKSRFRCWFFVRYADPKNHLRLRIRVRSGDVGQLLVALKIRLKATKLDGLVSAFTCDTYQRELERYGVNYIGSVEAVFAAGSQQVMNFVKSGGHERPLAEFQLALQAAYGFIRIFLPVPGDASGFAEEVSGRYLAEFKADKNLKTDLDLKYRGLKGAIAQWLSDTVDQELMKQVRQLARQMPAQAVAARRSMLADLVHMQLNRIFTQSQRRQELLVYYSLHKYLVSKAYRD